MERDARGLTPLLAVSIGTLSWLVAVVIIAAVLLGGMVLLNALDRRLPTRSPLGWFVWAEK